MIVDLPDLQSSETFGQKLGSLLFPGAILALDGPLGAGKTTLVRGIAMGLGVRNPAAVNSPTFVLIQEYPGRIPIFHFDAYRLTSAREFLELGTPEYFEANGVCLIEWAGKVVAALPEERLSVTLSITGSNSRQAELIAYGSRYEAIVQSLH